MNYKLKSSLIWWKIVLKYCMKVQSQVVGVFGSFTIASTKSCLNDVYFPFPKLVLIASGKF